MPVSIRPGQIEFTLTSVLWSCHAQVLANEFTLQTEDTQNGAVTTSNANPYAALLALSVKKVRIDWTFINTYIRERTIDRACTRTKTSNYKKKKERVRNNANEAMINAYRRLSK